MLKASGLFSPKQVPAPEPEIYVQGYGMITLAQAKNKVTNYIAEMDKFAKMGKWENVAHFAYGNGVLKAVIRAIVQAEEDEHKLKTSNARMTPPEVED